MVVYTLFKEKKSRATKGKKYFHVDVMEETAQNEDKKEASVLMHCKTQKGRKYHST